MRLFRVTAPTIEPITLFDAKKHLRVDHNEDDELISEKIEEARDWVETVTRRALVSQKWRLRLECFPYRTKENRTAKIKLPRGKAIAVTKFECILTDNSTLDLHGSPKLYQSDFDDYDHGVLRPLRNQSWPTLIDDTLSPVTIEYTVGYSADATDIPQGIISGLRYRLTDLYEVTGRVDEPKGAWTDVAMKYLEPYVINHFGGTEHWNEFDGYEAHEA